MGPGPIADLGNAFIAQQRARATPDPFVPGAMPRPAAAPMDEARREDAHAFLRYRVGYAEGQGGVGSIDSQAIAGVRWQRLLLIRTVELQAVDAASADRGRTALALDWPEASTRVTLGDVRVARPTGGEPLRLTGIGVRRASTLPADGTSLAPASGTTALSGEMTLSADGDGRYVAALRQDYVAAVLPSVAPGFAASSASLPVAAPRATSAALGALTSGLDRAPAGRPRSGSTDAEYAIGTTRTPMPGATPTEGADAFIASVHAGVSDDLMLGVQAQGVDGQRDAGVAFAVGLGPAGALRGSVGAARTAQGEGCATGSVDYRVAFGALEVAAAYAHGAAELPALRSDVAAPALQSVGGRVRMALSTTDSVALAADRASSVDAAPFTATRLTFRRTLAPTVALDGVVGYVSGTPAAAIGVPDGWVASVNVRWSLDPGRPASSF